MHVNLHELSKAFALAQKLGGDFNTPAVCRPHFLSIAFQIWKACGNQEPQENSQEPKEKN